MARGRVHKFGPRLNHTILTSDHGQPPKTYTGKEAILNWDLSAGRHVSLKYLS